LPVVVVVEETLSEVEVVVQVDIEPQPGSL
jgi:hypothetical protein